MCQMFPPERQNKKKQKQNKNKTNKAKYLELLEKDQGIENSTLLPAIE